MDLLLKGANEKREKEAGIRREAAKAKLSKETKAKAEQLEREAVYAAERLAQKEEGERRAVIQENLLAEERVLTGGLSFASFGMIPYRIEGEDDKIILPESCLAELNAADAFGRGPVILRLWAENFDSDSKLPVQMDVEESGDSGEASCVASHFYTHCGIREFSAPAGSIGVPDKVIQSLLARRSTWVAVPEGSDESEGLSAHLPVLGGLSVKYVVMPKVTYACLQPLRNAFQAVGEVKDCLEQNLRTHSALSVGDLVTIWHRGVSHQLRVKKMRPSDFGSLLQTDVEVDLDASEEYLQSSAASASASASGKSVSGAGAGAGAGAGRQKAGDMPAAIESPDPFARTSGTGTVLGRGSLTAPEKEKEKENEKEKEAAVQVPDEPSSSESGVVACRLRLPSGATLNRRFRRSDAIAAVFELAARALEVRRSAVCLSTSFPTRNIEYSAEVGDGLTLEEAGLTSNSVLMVSVR